MIQLSNGFVHLRKGHCDVCNDSPVVESEAGDRTCRLHAITHEERAAWVSADIRLPASMTVKEFTQHIAAQLEARTGRTA